MCAYEFLSKKPQKNLAKNLKKPSKKPQKTYCFSARAMIAANMTFVHKLINWLIMYVLGGIRERKNSEKYETFRGASRRQD